MSSVLSGKSTCVFTISTLYKYGCKVVDIKLECVDCWCLHKFRVIHKELSVQHVGIHTMHTDTHTVGILLPTNICSHFTICAADMAVSHNVSTRLMISLLKV